MENMLPNFMKKLDRFLLLHLPFLWATRFHLFVFFWVFALLINAGISSLLPADTGTADSEGVLLTSSAVISLIMFVAWVFQLRKFSVERDFGTVSQGRHYFRHFLFALSLGMIMYLPLFSFENYQKRVAAIAEYKELIADYNALNVGGAFFTNPYNDFLKYSVLAKKVGFLEVAKENGTHYNFRKFYTYSLIDYNDLATDEQIYNRVMAEFSKDGGKDAVEKYLAIIRKYGGETDGEASDVLRAHKKGEIQYVVQENSRYTAESMMSKIAAAHKFLVVEKKYPYMWILVLAFPLALVGELFSLLRLPDFLLSAAGFGVFVLMNVFFVVFVNEELRLFSSSYSMQKSMPIVYLLGVMLAVLGLAAHWAKNSVFTKAELFANVWSIIAFPLFGFFAVLLADSIYDFTIFNNGKDFYIFLTYASSVFFYLLVIYPFLREKLQALLAKPIE